MTNGKLLLVDDNKNVLKALRLFLQYVPQLRIPLSTHPAVSGTDPFDGG